MATLLPRSKTSSVHSSTFLRGTHQLDIIGYNARKELGGRNAVRSGNFEAGGCTWALVCSFENSALSKRDRHLASIALHLVSSNGNDVVATASLTINDPTHRWPPAVWRSSEAKTFLAEDEEDYWELSIPDTFRESRHVKDDRLTIHCTVGVLHEEGDDVAASTKNCSVSVVPLPNISHDLGKLLILDDSEDSKSSKPGRLDICRTDVTFVVEGTEIHAHKLVLAMRSPVFAAELLGGMKEGAMCARVTVDEMTASTFKAMLHFIYMDELPSFINVADVAVAGDLLVAADRYDLERLRLMCERALAENMDAASAVTTLMLVHGRDSFRQLEASCIEYMASHPDAVAATEEYKDLKETCGSFTTDILEKVWTRRAPSSSSSSTASSSSCQPQKTTSIFNPSKVFRGTHEFTIPNFCAVQRSLRADEYIQSGTFQVGGYEWILTVYPTGYIDEGAEEQKYLSLFLSMVANNSEETTTADVWVSSTYKMEDPSGEWPPVIDWAECYYGKVKIAGQRKFMDLASTKSYVGQNGALTVHCDIAITKDYSCTTTSTGVATGANMIDVPSPNIAWHLEQLLASEQGSDVKFLVQDSELRAHELILTARSLVMHEVVASAPDKDDIRINDVYVPVFKAVLHFIYTDELLLPVDVDHVGGDTTVVVRDLLVAADRFGLDRMKATCENALCENITARNVVATLELADRLHCEGFKNFCLEHISQPHMLKEAMEIGSFKDLKVTSPALLEEIMIKISKLLFIDL